MILSSPIYITDVDECRNKGLCEFGTCQNTDGDFKCNCLEGYKAINDGKRCKGNNYLSLKHLRLMLVFLFFVCVFQYQPLLFLFYSSIFFFKFNG